LLKAWRVVRPGDVVVDFGAGTGHLGLLVAWACPEAFVICLERKQWTSDAAEKRIAESGLANCVALCGDIGDLEAYLRARGCGGFQVGLGLHTCGLLTDLVLECCEAHGASFLLCPCCYGQVVDGGSTVGGDGVPRARPRSAGVGAALSGEQMALLARGGDMTVRADDEGFPDTPRFKVARACMRVVDLDRLAWCREHRGAGVRLGMAALDPPACSPKNNVVIGVRPERRRRAGLSLGLGWGLGIGLGLGIITIAGIVRLRKR